MKTFLQYLSESIQGLQLRLSTLKAELEMEADLKKRRNLMNQIAGIESTLNLLQPPPPEFPQRVKKPEISYDPDNPSWRPLGPEDVHPRPTKPLSVSKKAQVKVLRSILDRLGSTVTKRTDLE